MRTPRRIAYFICSIILLNFSALASPGVQKPQPPQEAALQASRAAMQTALKETGAPGLAVAVAIRGKIVWAEGFGLADVEQRIPVTRATKFGLGSVTKSLTMALVAKLVEDGKLNFDAPVERYLPDFPFRQQNISLRLIGGHLSGLSDHFDTEHYLSTKRYERTREMLQVYYQSPLQAAPRTKHIYITAGYSVIAAVIEQVEGRDFLTVMQQRLLTPLGLTNTVPNDPKLSIPQRTRFYVHEGGKSVPAPFFDPSYKWAGAGYLATAEDTARFAASLLRGRFLKPGTADELFRSLKTVTGEDTRFGLGWRIRKDPQGREIWWQPGGGPGISSLVVIYPHADIVIALLANQTGTALEKAEQTIRKGFSTFGKSGRSTGLIKASEDAETSQRLSLGCLRVLCGFVVKSRLPKYPELSSP